ncbi:hypothetical protein KBD61_04500 [Patescibacteria group bacterium]|nr:hypothetical protein [Patescibacteria group bacterium]MBP9710255.1 hypothetical protein [Patescibacteria group bacterium]
MNPSTTALAAPIHELHTASLQNQGSLVAPVTSVDSIVKAWDSFKELKFRLLNETDFATIKGERYAKKSTFRKLALAFGISVEIVREDHITFKDSTAFLLTARASSPNGRFMTAVGSCHTDEKKFSKASDARAVAQTRATNRCIADLVGWSAPSAEEIIGEEVEPPRRELPQAHPNEEELHEPRNAMTERQRTLLVSLINQKVIDSEEREVALSVIGSYSKEDASQVISSYLEPQPA